MEIKSRIFFAEKAIENSFKELELGKLEEKILYKQIVQALNNLKINAFSGIQIPKRLIPKVYIQKYQVSNLWKYDLPSGWRLIYTIKSERAIVISVILEWMDHKEYEKRFKY